MRWWRSPAWSEVAGGLALTAEEGFVLSLLESPVTSDEVVLLAGLSADRVEAILALLLDKGLAESDVPPQRLASRTIPDLDEPSAVLHARATFDSSEDITIERTPKRAPPPFAPAPAPLPTPEPMSRPPTSQPMSRPPTSQPMSRPPTSQPMSAPPSRPPSGAPPGPSQPIAFAPMLEAYTLFIKEDIPENTRASARDWIKSTFASASPEDRATFLWDSEGHTLPALAQVPFDARVAKILCAKTFTSQLLVSNLARCPTCPAALLTHMLKQPVVRRLPQLRRLILNHPNLPMEFKRRG